MTTLLARIAPNEPDAVSRKHAPHPNGFDLFASANGVSTAEVLDRLGIAHTESSRGEMATCPGCGEDGALVCKDGGIKCLHDRCSSAGPAKNPGFRTNVDLVAHVEQSSPAEAAKRICSWFGINVPRLPDRNSQAPHAAVAAPPPHFDEGETENLNFAPKRGTIEILESDAIFADLAPPDYLFAPIVARGSVTQVIAYGSSGKTWVAFDAAISAAAGVPWLGRFPAVQGRALYLDFENGSYEARRRIQAITRARELVTPVSGLALASMPALYLNAPDLERRIEALADGRVLMVIDTLRAATPGVDENDSRMRAGLDTLHRIGERTGCVFLVLAHAKKTSGSITAIDAREAGRGSSAIFDAADCVLHITYNDGEPLTVSQTKARSGRAVEPFQVVIRDTTDGGVLVVAQTAPEAQSAGNAADKFEAACMKVLDAVRQWPGSSKATLREHLGIRHATVSGALDRLAKDGAIRNAGTKLDPKWFPTGPGGRAEA